jgi:hypothetical protein
MAPLLILTGDDDNPVPLVLAPEIHSKVQQLPFDHAAFFDLPPNVQFIDFNRLIASRARNGGIVSANAKMIEASHGHRAKRPPLSVRRFDHERFLVVDGNSTLINGYLSGWPTIPCLKLDDAPASAPL